MNDNKMKPVYDAPDSYRKINARSCERCEYLRFRCVQPQTEIGYCSLHDFTIGYEKAQSIHTCDDFVNDDDLTESDIEMRNR